MYFLEILYLKDCPLSLELFSNISVYIYAQKILENMFTPILFALLELSSALKDNIGLLGWRIERAQSMLKRITKPKNNIARNISITKERKHSQKVYQKSTK